MNIPTKPSIQARAQRVLPIRRQPREPIGIFNVFRTKLGCMWCAVPEHLPVPWFVNGDAWVYDRKLDGEGPLPIGFIRRSAIVAIRYNGFYLFQLFDRSWA
jgi:hypothetical protein